MLDGFAADGYDLVLAGHTHGGQLRLPGYGALVTNCGIDRARARGASRWGSRMRLHVSAGLGTSPYAPVRFACPPEASLLTLVPRTTGPDARTGTPRRPPRASGRVLHGSRGDPSVHRGVAQLGSALRSGRRGRRFKSCHPDHMKAQIRRIWAFVVFGGATPRRADDLEDELARLVEEGSPSPCR